MGEEGAWQCPWFDVIGVTESKEVFCVDKGEGVSELQCCCLGVSVGTVQWLWGSVVVCDCVSLAACGRDDGSVLLLWFSWMILLAR